jgi:hypothetical protein
MIHTDATGTWITLTTKAGKSFAFRPKVLRKLLSDQRAIAILDQWLEEQELGQSKNFFDDFLRGRL